jgi:hypothetical protein
MNKTPLYISKSTVKSLWQKYHIYADRLEFHTLLGTVTIPFKHIETVNVKGSDIKGLLQGDLQLKNFRPAIMLDWANFLEHVVLDKQKGFCRRFLFTPEDPHEFKCALEDALQVYRQQHVEDHITS